jgi:hypothetical protein
MSENNGIPSPFFDQPENRPPPVTPEAPKFIRPDLPPPMPGIRDPFMKAAMEGIKRLLSCRRFVIMFDRNNEGRNDMMMDGYTPDQIDEIGHAYIELASYMRKNPPPQI